MSIELETSKIDLMSVLEQNDSEIAEDIDIDFDDLFLPTAAQLNLQAGGNGGSSPLQSSESSREVSGMASDDISLDLTWAEYLQKVKENFIKARPLSEVQLYASSMPFKDWMDYVIKLMPKDIKIQGEVNFKHLVAELGPIDKSQYQMLPEPVTDVEFCEVVSD